MFKLDGKVALVTGASRGIGRACAMALAEQGALVVVNYHRHEDKAREVVAGIQAAGGKAELLGFDVADTAAAEKGIADVAKRHGRLDILVANAGMVIEGLFMGLAEADLQKLFEVNVKGAMTCAKAALRPMTRLKAGRIIFLSSMIGEVGGVGLTAYAVTKAAVLGATRSIAREYATRNITVNAIAPGYIDTDMTSTLSESMKAQVLKAIPLGRLGAARDVAAAAVFLASDEAAYVTGQVLRVNGGMHA